MTSSYVLISEELMEDMFEISFTVIEHGVSPFTGLPRRIPLEVFESPITMPCEELIRDVPLFLRQNVANYISENNIEPLASEIISYYQQVVQRTAINGTTRYYHHLIPLIVYLDVNTTSDHGLIPLSFHLQTTALYADNEYDEYMVYTEIYHPTEPSIHHQQSSDSDESTEVNQVIEQSMQQLFIVPAAEKAMALLKRMELSSDDMKTSQCSICLESFDDDDEDVSALPCHHFFHNDCIAKWLKTGHTCPLCRFQFPVE
ncbi:uncharacterized protein LOC114749070 [Neltuma alba]|uniref:uncharacterized protein LOC114713599 n=1 Tax=Neltuma alba TaxID=207710 RepID=UPI0010A3B22F|nr:uncharacterized protein LOC114713599 [Prosopis alba]XP_028793370.1 uncharacterized protein LOC114749070 [Prosopis alba]